MAWLAVLRRGHHDLGVPLPHLDLAARRRHGDELTSGETCRLTAGLPAGASGTVAYECTATRQVPWSVLGTRSSARWTFATTPPAAGAEAYPGIMTVRLDSPTVVNGFAPAGSRQTVTLDVGHQFGADHAATKRLTFEVSYDDGKTWTKVTVHRTGDHATASLKHPKGAGFVSVRLSAVDSAGNTVTQTTIRSYGLN